MVLPRQEATEVGLCLLLKAKAGLCLTSQWCEIFLVLLLECVTGCHVSVCHRPVSTQCRLDIYTVT